MPINQDAKYLRDVADTASYIDDVDFKKLYNIADTIERLEAENKALFETRYEPWISVEDRLPKLREHIVLMTANRCWAMEPDSGTPHVTACGYLDADPNHFYWGIYGERSMPLDSFTHWMPLPQPPQEPDGGA